MPKLILASSSVHRIELLQSKGYKPDIVHPADIDEKPFRGELPKKLAERLAIEKAQKIAPLYPTDIVLAADTVATIGRLSLPKAETEQDARYCLAKLSGRRHRVYTGVCGIYRDKLITKIGMTIVKFKKLSLSEIDLFIASREWYNKAGGYGAQGLASIFISFIRGSHISNVIGMPMYETYHILSSFGKKPQVENGL